MANKKRFDFGPNTKPSWAVEKKRNDGSGKSDIYYGTKDSGNNHGHTVRNSSGSTDYERTQSGHVKYNKSKSIYKQHRGM